MVWQLIIGREIPAAEVPLEKWEVLAPHQFLQPGIPVLGREAHTIWLRGLSTCSLTHKLTHSKLQHRGCSLRNARNTQRGTELTSFREMAGGAGVRIALSRDRWTGRHHCSLDELSSHPANIVQVGAKSEISINLANTVCPALVIPWDPGPLNSLAHPSVFQQLFHTSNCLGSCWGLS